MANRAPASETSVRSQSVSVNGTSRQSVNVEPVSRQPVSVEECQAVRSNVQATNELPWWVVPYSSALVKSQRSKLTRLVVAPASVAPAKSQSTKVIAVSDTDLQVDLGEILTFVDTFGQFEHRRSCPVAPVAPPRFVQ